MHNKVVYRAAQALTRAGYDTLRFNFRGVGLSEGRYDAGRGEMEDFRAALDEAERTVGLPLVAGGFSKPVDPKSDLGTLFQLTLYGHAQLKLPGVTSAQLSLDPPLRINAAGRVNSPSRTRIPPISSMIAAMKNSVVIS